MKKTYKEYLEANDIISEGDFIEVMEWLPDVDIDFGRVDWCDYTQNHETLAHDIINEILYRWDYAYAEDVNWENKTIEIGDVRSVEDLNELKETFSKWTISNYDDLKQELEENIKQHKEEEEFEDLVCLVREKASLEQLREFLKSI